MNCGESLPNSVLGLFYGQRALALQEWKSPRGYASLGMTHQRAGAYAQEASYKAGAKEKADRRDVARIATSH